MIRIEIANTKPYTAFGGNAVKLLGKTLPQVVLEPTNDICICDFIDCEYVEPVFSDNGTDDYKFDFSEFLFKRFIASDSVELKLQKNGSDIADIVDDTYGELQNGFPNGNDEQQLYYGFTIDWTKVQNAFGSGRYNLFATITVLGNPVEYTSRKFNLLPYSDIAADGTVKIETTQNGNIFGSEFDFTGLEWKQYLRVPGRFGDPDPVYQTSRYKTENKEFKQIKDTMGREWQMETRGLSWEVSEKLIYNKLLANQILITDYSIKAEKPWRKIDVRLLEIDKRLNVPNPNKIYNIKFVDNRSIFEKTNF